MREITLEVNGNKVTKNLEDNTLLSAFLRDPMYKIEGEFLIHFSEISCLKLKMISFFVARYLTV